MNHLHVFTEPSREGRTLWYLGEAMETRKTPKPRRSAPKSSDAPPRRRVSKARVAVPAESIATIARPTQDDIARRAYEISQERNGQPGDALSDWLQAERELTADAI